MFAYDHYCVMVLPSHMQTTVYPQAVDVFPPVVMAFIPFETVVPYRSYLFPILQPTHAVNVTVVTGTCPSVMRAMSGLHATFDLNLSIEFFTA